MKDMKYFEPQSLSETVTILDQNKEEAQLIAGGTDFVVGMNKNAFRPDCLINISNLGVLDYIEYHAGKSVKIGALTTIAKIKESKIIREHFSIIFQATSQFACMAVRNTATLGGNLCTAAPSADMAPSLIALGAQVRITSVKGEKVVPLEEFFLGARKTILEKGEIVTEIEVPEPSKSCKGIYIKYAMRCQSDLPVVGIAVLAKMDNDVCEQARIVLSNVAPTPIRARKAEEIIKGQAVTQSVIGKCAEAAFMEACPRAGSIRASAEYKKEMVKVHLRRALVEITGIGK
ncbi:MAG: xanthine dehydrogenase family protein subunit M [Mesotoga sp.]|uniref:FAD binding domain-containing protein n=1 Tax=Mesotoga sp. TaxID=2053577 RepID=UPI00356271FD